MKKKLIALFGTAVVSMAMLCGCGTSTEKVVDKMFAEKTDSVTMVMDMDIDISAEIAGSDIDFALSGTTTAEVDSSDKDEAKSHISADLKATIMGETEKVKTEGYSITEDDEVTTYIKNPETGDWTYSVSEVDENPMDEKVITKITDSVKDVLKTSTLEKKTEKVGDEECYVLKLSTNADAFSDCIQTIWDSLGDDLTDEMEDAGVDMKTIKTYLSYIKTDITIYASKKTGKAVQIIVDMTESDSEGLLEQIDDDYGDMLDMFGIDAGDIELNIDAMKITATYSDWNAVSVDIPKKVKDNAVEASLLDDFDDYDDFDDLDYDDDDDDSSVEINSDGSITLYDYSNNPVIDVNVPDGYQLSTWSSNTWIAFEDDNWNTISVSQAVWLDWDDVVESGDKTVDSGYDVYYVVDDDGHLKMVIDLDITRDGYPVYATIEGDFVDDSDDISNASCTLCFRYNDDDDWVEVNLPEDAANWGSPDFEDIYYQLFG